MFENEFYNEEFENEIYDERIPTTKCNKCKHNIDFYCIKFRRNCDKSIHECKGGL